MKKRNKKILNFVIAIALIIIGGVLLAKNKGAFAVGISCGETAYSQALWNANGLEYSGIIPGSMSCSQSALPRSGTTFTQNHNYAEGWAGSLNFAYYIPTEFDSNYIFPPENIVSKYPNPEDLASNMECTVSGNIDWVSNYFGDKFDVDISYSVKGTPQWLGSGRAFRCVIQGDAGIGDKFQQVALQNNYFGLAPNMMCYGGCIYVLGTGKVTFDIIPEEQPSCEDEVEVCLDDLVIIKKQCINGILTETGNTCPFDDEEPAVTGSEGSIPLTTYYVIVGILFAVFVVILLKTKFK